jgi:radical SAM protein with 4Fe4S-binding SPASM domain
MKFLLETNPAFLILTVGDEYIFYNSLQHIGSRLTELEMLVLDLYYKYQNAEYIINKFPWRQQTQIKDALSFIDKHNLLLCEDLIVEDTLDNEFPTAYYLHLTYKCNLKCTYCYNKEIRKGKYDILSLKDWKRIVDKISPYAQVFTLTGGECFLYPDIVELLRYIKENYPNISIVAISNGMHDFEISTDKDAFKYLTAITFSCDSITSEGERKGFNPTLYRKNIKWVRENYPSIKVTIASTYTNSNKSDLIGIARFCQENECNFDKTLVIPENAQEVELMPDFMEQDNSSLFGIKNNEIKILHKARIRFGAGKSVCSIDPYGNVFPCQSLHYSEYLMGNLLNNSMEELKYLGNKSFCLKTVNDIPVCSKCKVKYICGGGCMATGYKFYGGKINRNHLACHLNYVNSIKILKSLNNRL